MLGSQKDIIKAEMAKKEQNETVVIMKFEIPPRKTAVIMTTRRKYSLRLYWI